MARAGEAAMVARAAVAGVLRVGACWRAVAAGAACFAVWFVRARRLAPFL